LWTGGLLLVGALVGIAAFAHREPPGAAGQTDGRPIQVAEDGYVSSDTCRACHPGQYDSWHTSFHRSMTQVATPDTVQADFDGTRVADVAGRPMLLQRRGTEFWAEFDDPDSGRLGPPSRITPASVMHHRLASSQVTGIAPTAVAWSASFQAPMSSPNGDGCRARWFLRPTTDHPSVGHGNWNAMCINRT
jgi:hypothetical protein